MNPSDSRLQPLRFRFLIRNSWWPPHPRRRVSSTGQSIFENMPTLLPRESIGTTSVIPAPIQRPSPSDHLSITHKRMVIIGRLGMEQLPIIGDIGQPLKSAPEDLDAGLALAFSPEEAA